MSVWDDPNIRVGGDYIQFENVGDTVSGTISVIRVHRFDDGKVVPQVLLTTDQGEERTMTAGQVKLKAALAEQRPEAGDHIKVTLTQIEKREGKKKLKHFDVQVTRAGQQPAPVSGLDFTKLATAVAGPAVATVPAQASGGVSAEAQAALAKLTPEQRAALGLV